MHQEWAGLAHANLPSRARWRSPSGDDAAGPATKRVTSSIVLRICEGSRMTLSVLPGFQPALRPSSPSPGRYAAATSSLYVLKFCSSVLRTFEDLPRVAGGLYRQRRLGRRIVAVVSALSGETDRLFAEAAAVAGTVSCRCVPDLVSLGEERNAALLRLACARDRKSVV